MAEGASRDRLRTIGVIEMIRISRAIIHDSARCLLFEGEEGILGNRLRGMEEAVSEGAEHEEGEVNEAAEKLIGRYRVQAKRHGIGIDCRVMYVLVCGTYKSCPLKTEGANTQINQARVSSNSRSHKC